MSRIEFKDTDRPKMVWLRTDSWRGISIGAVHWYGKLLDDTGLMGNSVTVMRKLTKLGAEKLNVQHNTGGKFHQYKTGEDVPNFDREGDVIEVAIRIWKKHFPNKTRLVLGDPMYCEYEELLDEVKR